VIEKAHVLDGRNQRTLFGRRKGPKLSRHQEVLFRTLLPQLELDPDAGPDPRAYFAPMPVDDIWLEIGFGGGEHLLWQAQHHANIGLIGAEPYQGGVAKLLSSLSPLGGEGRGEGELVQRGRGNLCNNIRIYQGDARDVIGKLTNACLGRVFILFPDPWPKTRHHKRRFMQTGMLDALARIMRPGAELRFASDDAGYIAWTLEHILAHPCFEWTAARSNDWKLRSADWPATRYEEKALHGPPVFLRFNRL
jgi:tRNA (guanine-N7-)-methyltransferase